MAFGARQAQRQRDAVAAMTPEQKMAFLARKARQLRDRRAAMTPERKAADAASRATYTKPYVTTFLFTPEHLGALPPINGRQVSLRDPRHTRLGNAVKRHYKGVCQVSGCPYVHARIEAAHIHAVADGGPADTDSRIPLCAIHHAMFDHEPGLFLLLNLREWREGHNPEPFLVRLAEITYRG
jgi:hypothetical protein